MAIRWKEHLTTLKYFLEKDHTLEQLAAYYGVGEETVRAAIFRHLPNMLHKVKKQVGLWKERKDEMEKMLREGLTYKEVGDHYGVSRQMILLMVERHLPHLKKEVIGAAVKTEQKKQHKLQALKERYGRDTFRMGDDDIARAMSAAFTRKKQNAKSSKWGWDILPSDLTFPITCPILGIELDWMAGSRQENSPSFDRLDSSKGYVKGNVIICSWRANRIKNDGSSKEHLQIADFLSNLGL